MIEKGWLGADLIFDLDGDHLPGVSDNDFPGNCDAVEPVLTNDQFLRTKSCIDAFIHQVA